MKHVKPRFVHHFRGLSRPPECDLGEMSMVPAYSKVWQNRLSIECELANETDVFGARYAERF